MEQLNTIYNDALATARHDFLGTDRQNRHGNSCGTARIGTARHGIRRHGTARIDIKYTAQHHLGLRTSRSEWIWAPGILALVPMGCQWGLGPLWTGPASAWIHLCLGICTFGLTGPWHEAWQNIFVNWPSRVLTKSPLLVPSYADASKQIL